VLFSREALVRIGEVGTVQRTIQYTVRHQVDVNGEAVKGDWQNILLSGFS
jgi:hypothetical protein